MLVAHEVEEGDADENVEDVNAGDAVEEDVKAGDAAEGDVSAAPDEVPTANEEPFHLLHHLLHHNNHLKLSLPLTKISMNLLQDLMDTCTTLTRRVEHMELDKIAQALEITKLNQRVKKPVRRNKGRMIADIDSDADVVLEEAKEVVDDAKDEPAELQEVVDIVTTAKIITEVVTAASAPITAADVPIPAATTAAVLTLTNNKPYYKIKRADDSHQLYLSILSLLRNFNREDLEALWSLVKKRFATTKPKNFSDNFLLIILGVMFEKPDIHAQIWKNQRSVHGPAKVKSWKLLESCGVQIITFITTQLILLVERKYPLTKFTLDQMLNDVRLEVKEESEVSLKLLRFIRQQHQEGAQLE
nr:hypothetical protein [Tanacetum cinerariifolium]